MMNKLILLIAALLIVTPAVASANLLSDADFEASGGGAWNGGQDTGFTRDFDSTDYARSPSQSLKISWGSVTGWGGATAEQNISVSAGQPWYAEVYAKIPTSFTGKEAYLETIYWTSSWAQLPDSTKLQSTKLSAATDWTKLTNSGSIPDTAAYAQYRLVLFGQDSTGGAVYFDDGVAAIPEPTSMLLLGSGLVGLLVSVTKKK